MDQGYTRWQVEIFTGGYLADQRAFQILVGIAEDTGYCVMAEVVARPTGATVCQAFTKALREFGVPAEVLTDGGAEFTEHVSRICRDNGGVHRPASPLVPSSKTLVERFGGNLLRQLDCRVVSFADLSAAQAAVAKWVARYNATRQFQ
ncbi:DDE-type integrase/transposase/recombinase [Planotetraspora phitsanulokensis]|uniref:DDE-type integrase/transposase/recombinase n=1 Tax=Planotetraspora phitsanulokensis TaxID=575192 RepID=UPI00194EB4D5|nr:DDE-type integrase/transposase/recombinase [Planotetraspora phitsanulokensis]